MSPTPVPSDPNAMETEASPDDATALFERAGLSQSERSRLLASECRQTALSVLSERRCPVDLDELAAAVAEHEAGDGDPASDRVSSIATALHHNHLPRMADMGVVNYDPESGRVA
ncbi:DUF7344 domain-containing protein (plasmid) [Haloarcula salina]|uniref:DUF7344 domain-containing protein n=1 Tax=Haloarcula salina TaxID=1429914 RepID=UPI003C6F36C4